MTIASEGVRRGKRNLGWVETTLTDCSGRSGLTVARMTTEPCFANHAASEYSGATKRRTIGREVLPPFWARAPKQSFGFSNTSCSWTIDNRLQLVIQVTGRCRRHFRNYRRFAGWKSAPNASRLALGLGSIEGFELAYPSVVSARLKIDM
jgi:hypothetical protein